MNVAILGGSPGPISHIVGYVMYFTNVHVINLTHSAPASGQTLSGLGQHLLRKVTW